MTDQALGQVRLRQIDPTHPDARQCMRAYFAELDRRSDTGYDPATGISAEPHELTPPAGCLLVAYLDGEPVACGAVKHHPGAPSQIKRMWVSPAVRGLGIGRRVLAELEACAWRSGTTVVGLETNRMLVEAIALYRSSGYREVAPFNEEPFAHHWFEKQLGGPDETQRPQVDESLIRHQLELTPAQRLHALEAMYVQARQLARAGARSRGELG